MTRFLQTISSIKNKETRFS